VGYMHDAAKRSGTVVLVVEDEPFTRMHAVITIENAGYNVIEAGNADEAIVILETREDIRVVVTDIEMPGSMDGIKLARAIRDRWPPIELIVTSGRDHVSTDELPLRAKFMSKPYAPAVLVTAIRTLHRVTAINPPFCAF
jgi:CheY-like chemotaxis protein